MQQGHRYYLKFIVIFFLMVLLLIPQAMLMSLIGERESWRHEAYQSIQQSWPGSQTLAGPLLYLPYEMTHTVTETVLSKTTGSNVDDKQTTPQYKQITREVTEKDALLVIPKRLSVNNLLDSSVRYRGIYEVPVYSGQVQVVGMFDNQAMLDLVAQHKDKSITWGQPQLSVLVRDQRGIANPPALNWNEQALNFQPGSQLSNAESGMHASLPTITSNKVTTLPFSFDLELRGMSSMNFALLSEDSAVNVTADWPHPKFVGELLPEERTITDTGFTANWRASSFSYNVSSALARCAKGDCNGLMNRSVGFDLHQPVDIYQQSERSIKYALLFVVLTFVALVMFELLKTVRVHPVQYTLVGLALTVFYLLLISLSEHVSFFAAYIIAALASTGLLTLYFGAILHSRKLGMVLGGALLTLYGLLYVILQAESQALLMGSLLLFAVLAGIMLATRNLDWYALTHSDKKAAKEVTPETGDTDVTSASTLTSPPKS